MEKMSRIHECKWIPSIESQMNVEQKTVSKKQIQIEMHTHWMYVCDAIKCTAQSKYTNYFDHFSESFSLTVEQSCVNYHTMTVAIEMTSIQSTLIII